MRRILVLCLFLLLAMSLAVSAQEATPEPTAETGMEGEAPAEVTLSADADNNAHVRFANFSPDGGGIQISLNGEVSEDVGTLDYPSMSEWVTIPVGTVSIAIVGEGASADAPTLGPADLSVSGGTWQTIAVVGSSAGGTLNAIAIQEAYEELLPGTGGLTFLHAAEGIPPVNLHRDNVVYFAQLSYPSLEGGTSYSTLPEDAGVHNFAVSPVEDPETVLAEAAEYEVPENAYLFMALIGTEGNTELFTHVTDRSAVEIALGNLPEPGRLIDALNADENLTALAAALQSSDLAATLGGEQEYTIFAPANFVLDNAASGEVTADVLQAHIVEGKFTSRDIVAQGTLTSLAGTPLEVTVQGNNVYVNGAQVIDVNIPATNGVIHMVNGLVTTGGTAGETAAEATAEATQAQ